jgi:cyclophilin family peptidyl-prolyl cis-trans isomerase
VFALRGLPAHILFFCLKKTFMRLNILGLLVALSTPFLMESCASTKAQFALSNPLATFTAPASVSFQNTSKLADRYEWDFGDQSPKDTAAAPMHRFRHSGNFTVTLRAFKGTAMSVTTSKILVQAPVQCTIEIETDYGTMVGILYSATPKHRDNFTKLADENYFDGLLFHRVISGFMLQGGDPNSRNAPEGQSLGMGGPGYQVPAEFVDTLVHTKGAICAARTNNPKKESSGSQFYIVQGKPYTAKTLDQMEAMKNLHYSPEQRRAYLEDGGTPQLDREYTVFGRIVEGLDVIDKIASVRTRPGDRPEKDVKMKIRVVK